MKNKDFYLKAATGVRTPRRAGGGQNSGAGGRRRAPGAAPSVAPGVAEGAARVRRGPLWASRLFRRGAAALLLLFFIALAAHQALRAPRPGPYVKVAVSAANLETYTAENQPLGLDTFYPPAPDGQGASLRAPSATGAIRLDAQPADFAAGRAAFSVYAVSPERGGLLRFSYGTVSIETQDGPVSVFRLGRSSLISGEALPDGGRADLFEADYFSGRSGGGGRTPPLLYGEPRDAEGLPARWSLAVSPAGDGDLICDHSSSRMQSLLRALIRGLSVPGQNSFSANAGKYTSHAYRYAEKYGLAASLVLAIMHTESNFNPFAVSPSRAVGLMQIVPDTAGHEAHRYLTGSLGEPSLELLFTPEDNIRYGVAYLHLLARRYFGGVIDGRSRQMCVIAAYNGGPGAVMRLFDPLDQAAAVARINAMTPEQVYAALTSDMPNAETRRYVELVLNRMRHYGI